MPSYKTFLRWPVSILVYTYLLPLSQAGPAIDVSLRAAFPAPPLLVELLDTAAAEDSTAFLPLLDKIASGAFVGTSSDQELYNRFLKTLEDDKIFKDPSALSSWKLALSVHEAAPRIEAQYQFWNSTVRAIEMAHVQANMIPALAIFKPNNELCADPQCTFAGSIKAKNYETHAAPQPFDRVVGSPVKSESWTIYVDPADPDSMASVRVWRNEHADASFRLRYRVPHSILAGESQGDPLYVSGYGVELALKRTDYIVIDDRDAENKKEEEAARGGADESPTTLAGDGELRDVTPLSSSELLNLGINTASFILQSDNPMDKLLSLAQDFPKHASSLSAHNATEQFLDEHYANRQMLLPAGYNVMWINGVQIGPRDVNVFSLLDHLRRERRLMSGFRDLGVSSRQAVNLLSHSEIAEAQTGGDAQRYDTRDDIDGGRVIIWLNNIEKDKRYAGWPEEIKAVLQRTYPGQLPQVKKEIHNLVFPVDLTKPDDASLVVKTLQTLVQRMLPIRFGIVPAVRSQGAAEQARIVYFLQEAYGLAAVMQYLEASMDSGALASPSLAAFTHATAERKLRKEKQPLALEEILALESFGDHLQNVESYLKRLSAYDPEPPFFVNGAPITMNEEWMQALGMRVSTDLRKIQQLVFDDVLTDDDWLPSIFLKAASPVRNPLVVPEDETAVKLFDMNKLWTEHESELSGLKSLSNGDNDQPTIIVFLDLNTDHGCSLLVNAVDFALQHDEVKLSLNHYSDSRSPQWSDKASECLKTKRPDMAEDLRQRVEVSLQKEIVGHGKKKSAAFSPLANAIGLQPGEQGILINGRLLGPLPPSTDFIASDFEVLVSYERKKRISPVLAALEDLDLLALLDSPEALSKISSAVALSFVSDVPEGMFEAPPQARITVFENWKAQQTCITLGSTDEPALDIVVSLDPVSEIAQRWLPILNILSEMAGVRARLFLNPSEKLQELPTKRFYRQVLNSAPSFTPTGQLQQAGAKFLGIPEETLLTLALDTPPSWLVAPKESVYDLDNVKLSSIKGQGGISATYELEHILIEGHSRDTTTGSVPRGVQLALSTETTPDFAGTIIMANLGYFQFKANPGVYNLALQRGASTKVFNIESAGTLGHSPKPNDETTEIALYSFQGATIFPRLSRKPGRELDDVLEMPDLTLEKTASAASARAQAIIARGGRFADDLLEMAGIANADTAGLIAKGWAYGQSLVANLTSATQKALPKSLTFTKKHADINIFSVASGHLYERMLNIMMVSVMRHTQHTVKFWFIEQFLSPSFKEFLPTMAAEYGFEYEMVTYKWPHWLRAQTEKQRVIWGYKILFLDVLFPLDLDKVIFVDADQIVRTDMYDLVQHDLEGAPYGFTPMCDSRTEMEGFRFWKQGYWKNFLRGLPYHISALYVVDLKLFRAMAAGDRLRQQYHSLSADPNSLSNLDQDLPNHMQMNLPIHSLPQEWLWCETWCSDESLEVAKTIDLCNNPMTKEPKLDRARRQVPEWNVYDEEIAALARRKKGGADGALGAEHVVGAGGEGAKEPVGRKDEL